MTRDEWREEGIVYVLRARRAAWALGDWLVRGQSLGFDDTAFTSSAVLTGFSPSYLYALRFTSEAWPVVERNLQLAWGVHRELARVADAALRADLFARAQRERWTQHETRSELRACALTTSRVPVTRSPSHGYVPVQVACPCCGHTFAVRDHKVALTTP